MGVLLCGVVVYLLLIGFDLFDCLFVYIGVCLVFWWIIFGQLFGDVDVYIFECVYEFCEFVYVDEYVIWDFDVEDIFCCIFGCFDVGGGVVCVGVGV